MRGQLGIARLIAARGIAPLRQRLSGLPLRWRLALGYASVLVLVLAPLAALQAGVVQRVLLQDAEATLRAQAIAGAKLPRGNVPLVSGLGLTTILLDATGRVLDEATAQGVPAPPSAALIDARAVRQVLRGGSTPATTYQMQTARGPYLVALASLPPAKKPKAQPRGHPGPAAAPRRALLLAEGLAAIEATTTKVWLLSLVGTGLALLVATILGALLVRRALRPLGRVAAAAEAMAAGDYARRVAVPPARDEVGDLARSYNAMAAAVEDAFATQRRFVADAAHELRTPLTALGGYADVLLMGAATEPRDLALALETMRGEAHRMTRLVNSLLILARLDAGQLVPLGAVELGALLRETAASLSLLHPDRRVGCTIEAEPMVVRGDPDRLRQVVANLADNALAFTDARGSIDLALRAEAGMARITVADDGIGIAPEDLPYVRDRFYRAAKARDRASGGTGLGLAIVEAIVVAHGGSVEIRSAPGRGTTVTVNLPIGGGSHGASMPM